MSFLDPNGLDVIARTSDMQQAILDMVPEEDREFVVFDENGNIDKNTINKRYSKSTNFIKLQNLVNKKEKYIVKSHFGYLSYKKESGKKVEMYMDPIQSIDKTDPGCYTPSTGEQGFMGYSISPEQSCIDNNFSCYINLFSSRQGKAETLAEELLGHAYLYSNGKPWGHIEKKIGKDWLETNNLLKIHIIKAKQETIQNTGIKP